MTSPMPTQTIAPARTWSAVLFDLDGTIVDSASDITASLAHMFTELGVDVPSDDVLRSYVGPPLLDSLRLTAGFDDAEAWEALNVYRDHYADHVLRSPVFPGVAGVLERLHAAGVPVALATSKPESMAREVLDHAGLTQYFTVITGASDDEELSTKADVVREALRRLREQRRRRLQPRDGRRPRLRHARRRRERRAHDPRRVGLRLPRRGGRRMAVVHSTDQLRNLLLG